MLTETLVEDPRWEGVEIAALCERAARATLEHLEIDPEDWEIAILACDDARISALNADFRDKPQPTNVLSWPSVERAAPRPGAPPQTPVPADDPELGDIAIAYDTCAREAEAAGRPLCAHATHLVVHAVLHLLGYDHIGDEDAALMQALEVRILCKLGLDDPY